MNIRLQLIVGITLVVAIIYVINKVRTGKVDLRYVLIWLFLGLLFLAFNFIPQLQIFISRAMGIASPQNMLIFMSIGFILVLQFNMTVIVSKQTKRIERLIQENALLASEIEEIKKMD
mgnify:CR=1 FL=1